jgi:hypothetical protein
MEQEWTEPATIVYFLLKEECDISIRDRIVSVKRRLRCIDQRCDCFC